MRPGIGPGAEREAARKGDEAILRDLRQIAERIGDDDEQRRQIDDREYYEEAVNERTPEEISALFGANRSGEFGIVGGVNHAPAPPGWIAIRSTRRRGPARQPARPAS